VRPNVKSCRFRGHNTRLKINDQNHFTEQMKWNFLFYE
jgi:hypothetical protein